MNNTTIHKIKNSTWQKWGTRRVTIRWGEHFLLCTLNFKKIFGLTFPNQLILAKDEIGYAYLDKNQLDGFLKLLLKKLYNSSFYEIYEKKALPFLKKFLRFSRSITSFDLPKLSQEKLLGLYEEFIEQEDIFTNFLWIIFVMDDHFSQELECQLEKYLGTMNKGNKLDEHLKVILSPDKKSAIFTHAIDILKVADEVKNKKIKGREIEKRIKSLKQKYSYFPIINFDERFYNKNYFQSEINKILRNKEIKPDEQIKKINNQFYQNKIQYEKLIKTLKLKFNPELFRLVEACHKIAYYRDYRNDVRRKSYFYAKQLYQEIAKRLDIRLTELLFLVRDEVRSSLIKEKLVIKPSEIKNRRKYYALVLLNGNMHYIFHHQKITHLFKFIEPYVLVKDFRGISANPGKVRGRVRIILSTQKDSLKFKQGDILVTPMTNLDFVPLIAKAGAIITDEGGLLCHAAIVSREMNKPCLVGTEIAIKVLKDNDLIEVNANHGLVKIL